MSKSVEVTLVCRTANQSLKSECRKVLWKFYRQSIFGNKSRGRKRKNQF